MGFVRSNPYHWLEIKEKNMKLVIDCFKLVKGAGKSIGIYNLALNLARELAASNGGNEIVIFGNSHNRRDFDLPGAEFVEIRKNPLDKLTCVLWELFEVSVKARKMGADKVLFPRGYVSMLHLTKEAVIIHDMIPFFYRENYPGYFNRLENFYITWRLKASARSADSVITISEASRRDIMKYAHVPENRITVINNGCNLIPKRDYDEPAEEYIMAVTSPLPHKNAEGVIKSYEAYCRIAQNPLPLKIVGIDSIGIAVDAGIAEKITCIKYVEKNEDFHRMIYGAKLFLFLSLIEGFGFPPVEAMQLGTVAVCSDTSSLPEVAGDAAVYVDPTDYEGVARAIVKILADDVEYERLRGKGFENIERFSWEQTLEKYREVLF